jgi:GNAT superfamily N-acetyltransferase
MTHSLHTRIATAADAAALAELNALFNGVRATAEQIAAQLARAAGVEAALLGELDGIAAGFACVRITPCVCYAEPAAELTELFVVEAWRGRGLGRALILHAEQLARQRGAEALLVLTGKDNAPAQRLYRAMGFVDGDIALHKPLG